MGGEKERVKLKFGESYPEENIYVGETSRSIFERSIEHLKAGRDRKEESFVAKHWQESHPQREEAPEFRFKIVKSFRDPLTRQVSESIRIDLRRGVLNSKTMYSRNSLPRLTLEKTDWEKKKEEKEKEAEKRESKERREKWLGGGEINNLTIEGETENYELECQAWEIEAVKLEKGKKRNVGEQIERTNSKKRRKVRGWRKEENHDWGLIIVEEDGWEKFVKPVDSLVIENKPTVTDLPAKLGGKEEESTTPSPSTSTPKMRDIKEYTPLPSSSGMSLPRTELPGKMSAISLLPGGAEQEEEPEERYGPTRVLDKVNAREQMVTNSTTVASKRVYKQGLRRMKQEIENGIQPRIFNFLSKDSGVGKFRGGQPPVSGESGGGCVDSAVRKRSCPNTSNSMNKKIKCKQKKLAK